MNREDVTMRRARKLNSVLCGVAIGLALGGSSSARGDEAATKPAGQGAAAAQIATAGEFAVDVVPEVMLHDKRRDKDLPVYVSYPKGEGPFPVIVFSHGAGGTGRHYEALLKFWSSHGYVCLAPTHAESLSLRNNRNGEPPDLALDNKNNNN